MASVRRLAAIMFTDWVGFTTLTQSNEQHALTLLEIHQRILRPVFPRFHGTEIKTIGDAFLVEFESALDATSCAIEIQRLLHDYNASSTAKDRIRLRIGIHLGDVIHADGDVLGDAINVASRIEPLAEPEGICISDPVFAQIRNKLSNPLTKLPARELKNVQYPLDVYKVELPWTASASDAGGASIARRLAVLPLANMSPDPQDAFFADGLTEEIISELSKVAGLRVIARTSVMRYAGGAKGVAEIGRELRVGTVLEGSVRRAGNRVRVTAQLIDASNEEHLWSEKYDRELVDIFAIQSEIAKEVAVAMGVALPPPAVARRRAPPSLTAFKPYLRGRSLWNRRSPEHLRAALRNFEEALAIEPDFAEALSGIADCYSILVDRGVMLPSEGGPKARAAAERAIQIDETIAEAHASLGLALAAGHEWLAAEREYKRAIELNPMYASAHQWYYMELTCLGRREEAWRELDAAEEADPLSPVILFHRGFVAWVEGRDDAALQNWARFVELGGDPAFSHLFTLLFYANRSRWDEAAAILPLVMREPQGWLGAAGPAVALAVLGKKTEALQLVEAMVARSKVEYVSAGEIAWVFGALGDADRFFEWLYRSVDQRTKTFDFIASPIFEKLRADPRFHEYLRRCGVA